MRWSCALALALSASLAAADEPASTIHEVSPSAPPPPPPPTVSSSSHAPSPQMIERWHTARVLYGVGTVTGIVGGALTLSSVLIVAITGYPCDPNDPVHALNPNDACNKMGTNYKPPKPTDPVPLLGYIGASTSALGFIFSASGLGYQHRLLDEMSLDPGRGVFAAGTTFGLVGFAGIGAGYFFGLTSYLNPHDQGIAIIASTVSGAVLCAIGSLLYTIDEGRVMSAWRHVSNF